MNLFNYFIKRSFIVNLVSFFVVICGLFSISSMKRDLRPAFDFKQIKVDVSLPGANSEEMEMYVTFPIENAIRGLPGVEEMMSTSRPGSSEVILKYSAGFDDILSELERVRNKVNAVKFRLPQEIRYLNVSQNRADDLFLSQIGFENIDVHNPKHRRFYEDFEKKILNIPGIVKIYKSLPRRDVYIRVKPEELTKNEISMAEVANRLRNGLNFSPIGQAIVDDELIAVQIEKSTDSLEEIRNLELRSNYSGQSLKISDIAEVKYDLADQFSQNFLNAKPMAGMWVIKDAHSDAIDLKTNVMGIMKSMNESAPEGLQILNIHDGPRYVEQQIRVLLINGLTGFVLVFIVLMLFLNWRTAILTAMGLPLAYLGTFTVLYVLGIKIDLISLVGLILVVGILVDDAIIVAERYNEFLSQGFLPKEAASKAVRDMVIPVTGGILTTVVAFLPMILIKSDISTTLFAIPAVVITSLTISWIECFFILPNHLAHFVNGVPVRSKEDFIKPIQRAYEKCLGVLLKARYVVVLFVMALMGLSVYVALNKVQHSFNLELGRERVSVLGALKSSDSVDDSVAMMKPLQDYVMSFPESEVDNVGLYVGDVWMDGAMRTGKRFVKLVVNLAKDEAYPSRLAKKLNERLRDKLKELDTEKFEKIYVKVDRKESEQKIEKSLRVWVSGQDSLSYDQLENALKDKILALPEIKEFVPDPSKRQTNWVFEPNQEKLIKYGMNNRQVASQVRGYFTPDEILETRLDGEQVYIFTEILGRKNLNFETLSQFHVVSPRGAQVPLNLLGQWKQTVVLKRLRHKNGLRQMKFDFRLDEESGNFKTAKESVAPILASMKKTYQGYDFRTEKTDETAQDNQNWGLKVAGVCILAVLMVMSLTLGSVTQPFIVGLPIPFGLIGIIMALYLHNMPLGIMSIIGLIGTVGVSVNASIIVMDQMNKLKEQYGSLSKDVIIEACSDRLRAIILTTLTTLGGLIPMAYAFGGESGYTQPLAFSMGWGLIFATLLTLFAMPALVLIGQDIRFIAGKMVVRARRLMGISIETVEPTAFDSSDEVMTPDENTETSSTQNYEL